MPEPLDPRWPKVLSLAVHEFRTPMTVVSGYIRMLLKERAGAITDQQRRLLEEAEKSCGRLSALVSEVSELSSLEAGTSTFNRQLTDLRSAIRAAAAQLPPLPDRDVAVELELHQGAATITGDPARLTQAFAAILAALRREIVDAPSVILREIRPVEGRGFEFRIGDGETLAGFEADADRPVFDEWRGGVGLSLAIARRVIQAHGGQLQGAPGGKKTGAAVLLDSR